MNKILHIKKDLKVTNGFSNGLILYPQINVNSEVLILEDKNISKKEHPNSEFFIDSISLKTVIFFPKKAIY